MTCKECKEDKVYIGETERQLKERFNKHTSESKSSVNQSEPARHAMNVHARNSKDQWDLKILRKCNGYYERKIAESQEIKKGTLR